MVGYPSDSLASCFILLSGATEQQRNMQYLYSEVDNLEVCDWLWPENDRTQSVEERLEYDPQQLSERVVEQATFKARRDVHVHLIVSLILVMLLPTNSPTVSPQQ